MDELMRNSAEQTVNTTGPTRGRAFFWRLETVNLHNGSHASRREDRPTRDVTASPGMSIVDSELVLDVSGGGYGHRLTIDMVEEKPQYSVSERRVC